jgi:hypothetical protein
MQPGDRPGRNEGGSMSFERAPAGTGIGAEPAQAPGATAATTGEGASAALRLQILATEHWSLLATRSLAWNESFSRSGMFLATLSGAIVALALAAQASSFGNGFILFALVILPVVLFVGVATFVRLGASNYNDAMCVIGMNRIRAAYLELAPELGRYFVTSANDDPRGVSITMGIEPGTKPGIHLIAATPVVVSTLNAVIVGAITALVGVELGLATTIVIGLAALGFAIAAAVQQRYSRAAIARGRSSIVPMFPTLVSEPGHSPAGTPS